MYSIDILLELLPIKCSGYTIDLLTFTYMDSYVQNLLSDYYNEFLDYKFNQDMTEDTIREELYKLIVGYRLKLKNSSEARIILTKDNELIGGCTLTEKENDITMAYFIIPEYHKNGLATLMLTEIIQSLIMSRIRFDRILVKIQSINKASLALAKKLGFKEIYKENGVYTTNIVMAMERNGAH
ncbi:MAG: GNAT family N-acetyltransferase [Lachnospiraceae bacterium]|nr:GNAT family N-acetyltransferase [Lachnospiraceae bacterium]